MSFNCHFEIFFHNCMYFFFNHITGDDMASLIPIEAVLPLPTCRSNSGCRSVVNTIGTDPKQEFELKDFFEVSAMVQYFFSSKNAYM